jgi:hypothetical protein
VHVRRVVGISMMLAALLATLGVAVGAFAAGNTMRIDPATSTVAKDGTFQVKVIQAASVVTSGSQATITFDRTKVQVTTVTKGAPFVSAALFLSADPASIASANKSGKLKSVSAAFLPPGSVAAGTAEFVTVGFKATGCGDVKLGLPAGNTDAILLDGRDATYGKPLTVSATGATVTIACDGSVAAASSSGAAASGAAPSAAAASGDVPPGASPSGDVLGATATVDPGASGGPNAAATAGTSQPPLKAAAVVTAVRSSDPGAYSGDPYGTQQEAWLTFALAALAVAAVGLALLIVLVVAGVLITAIVGPIVLVRSPRPAEPTPPTTAAPSTPGGSLPTLDVAGSDQAGTGEQPGVAEQGVPDANRDVTAAATPDGSPADARQ